MATPNTPRTKRWVSLFACGLLLVTLGACKRSTSKAKAGTPDCPEGATWVDDQTTKRKKRLMIPFTPRRRVEKTKIGWCEKLKGDDTVRHGRWLLTTPKGAKLLEGEYYDDLPHGVWRQWSRKRRKLLGSFSFVHGTGTFTRWRQNGKKRKEGKLVKGFLKGGWTRWSKKGKPKAKRDPSVFKNHLEN